VIKVSNLFWFYFTVFISFISVITLSLVLYCTLWHNEDGFPDGGDAPTWGETVTYIENENGSVRLTDHMGFAFEFEVKLKRDFADWGFEIMLYGEYENRLIISSTKNKNELSPKIFVNGRECDALPTEKGVYEVRIDLSHITSRGFSTGNSLNAFGFGKIDLISMY
jgi:hypothetical protein